MVSRSGKSRSGKTTSTTSGRPARRSGVVHGRQEVRITGGSLGSRRLRFPAAQGLRPTPDRVRETLFNWLGQDLSGLRTLDLFAGSGVLGVEAWSRGAAWVGFVERSAPVVKSLRQNLDILALPPKAYTVWSMDARGWLHQAADGALSGMPAEGIDLVFVDPPFGSPDLVVQVIEQLSEAHWLAGDAAVYLEYGSGVEVPALDRLLADRGWRTRRAGQAGESHFRLLARGD